jgi:hypothetical protein
MYTLFGGIKLMAQAKMIYVAQKTHGRLKLLAAQQNRTMGEMVEHLLEKELADLANPWTSLEGLLLQQKALEQVWNDPKLDVYDDD